MNFLSPAWLWTLATLLPLAAVYFLKVRPRKKPTNAFFLWEKILAQKQSSALFRRLRDVVSLVLMLIAAGAIAFALGRPQLQQADQRDLLVVLDTSVSMKAGSPSRFSQAKDKVRDIVRAMNGSRRVALASLGRELRFETHLSDSPKDLLESIDSIQASDSGLSHDALASLGGFVTEDSSNRVIFVTDASGDFTSLPSAIEVVVVGEEEGNLGITAADMQWLPGRSNTAAVFLTIGSSFQKDQTVEFEVRNSHTGMIGKLAEITVPPGAGKARVYEIEDVEPGPWQIRLLSEDALEIDNVVDLGLNPSRPIPVQVDADDPFFFQRCIEAFSLGGGKLRPGGGKNALVVSVGTVPKERDAIIFAPNGASEFWKSIGDEVIVGLADTENDAHPVIEHIDLNALAFAGAREIELVDGATVIASSETKVPLIFKVQKAEQTVVVVNLDPAQGDFFLSPWFPILVYDTAIHLAGRDEELPSVSATGNVVTLPSSGSSSTVTSPSGQVISGSSLTVDQPGIYTAEVEGKRWIFGAAVLNESESLMPLVTDLKSSSAIESGFPLAVWLLFIALIILCVEAILYHRRKAG